MSEIIFSTVGFAPPTDEQIVERAVLIFEMGARLACRDGVARVIATQWHGGQMSALYSFASCGSIRDDLESEILYEMRQPHDMPVTELGVLLQYVEQHTERGPVAGWARLWG